MQENPYAPPESNLIKPLTNKIVLASRWKRFCAAFVDGAISYAIMMLTMFLTGGFETISVGKGHSFLYLAFIVTIGIIAFIIIHGKLLAEGGQTVGKKLLGIKITDLEGNLPDLIRHILPRYGFRTVITWVPIIGGFLPLINFLFIFGEQRRCVHDLVAKTIVVYKNPGHHFAWDRDKAKKPPPTPMKMPMQT